MTKQKLSTETTAAVDIAAKFEVKYRNVCKQLKVAVQLAHAENAFRLRASRQKKTACFDKLVNLRSQIAHLKMAERTPIGGPHRTFQTTRRLIARAVRNASAKN